MNKMTACTLCFQSCSFCYHGVQSVVVFNYEEINENEMDHQ